MTRVRDGIGSAASRDVRRRAMSLGLVFLLIISSELIHGLLPVVMINGARGA